MTYAPTIGPESKFPLFFPLLFEMRPFGVLCCCSTLLDVARRLLDVLLDVARRCSTFARRSARRSARRCSTLLDVARRCSTLLDVARRCSTLLDVFLLCAFHC